MRTKKSRSGKAVKPAARTVRRAARRSQSSAAANPARRKPKLANAKPQKKPKRVAKRKTRAAVKTKTVRKRLIRKPRAKASSIPPESAPAVSPLFTGSEVESGAAPSEQIDISEIPGSEPPGETTAQAEAGLRIPQILLEGDEPFSPPMTGPGQKYALGPTTPAAQSGTDEAALPEAYGTGKLLLAARDPHWLYAHWDLTPQQQRRYNALSADRHLVVRVFAGALGTRPVKEVHVHPESRHWFIHADHAETRYVAELGYYRPGRQWVTISTSAPAVTPPDAVSADQTVRFATIPAQVRLTQLAALAKQGVPADLPPPEAARERALAELVSRCTWCGRTREARQRLRNSFVAGAGRKSRANPSRAARRRSGTRLQSLGRGGAATERILV